MEFIHFLTQIDQKVLLFINGLHTSFLDVVMWKASEKVFWYPLYAVLILFMVLKRKKYVWITLLAVALMILLSDQSADFLKNTVQRLRPTHTPAIAALVHVLHGYRGGSFGFVSSHASNTFAAATFTSLFFSRRWFTFLIFFWASLVSYSRMYLGVHYPLDVLCGGMIGVVIGLGIFQLEKWAQHRIGQTSRG